MSRPRPWPGCGCPVASGAHAPGPFGRHAQAGAVGRLVLREAFFEHFNPADPKHAPLASVLYALRTVSKAIFWIENRNAIASQGGVALPPEWIQGSGEEQGSPLEIEVTREEDGRYQVSVIFSRQSGGVLRLTKAQLVQLHEALGKELV